MHQGTSTFWVNYGPQQMIEVLYCSDLYSTHKIGQCSIEIVIG